MGAGWHTERHDGTLTVSRQLPVRFDVSASATMPRLRKGRLAHQIRQDLRRLLRHVRGFCPAVRVVEDGPHLIVTAGGRITGRGAYPKAQIEEKIAGLLGDPDLIRRWSNNAKLADA